MGCTTQKPKKETSTPLSIKTEEQPPPKAPIPKDSHEQAEKYKVTTCTTSNSTASTAKDTAITKQQCNIFQDCPAGHTLKQDYTKMYPFGLFRCEICGGDQKLQPRPWTCNCCRYDICDSCYSGNIKQFSTKIKCPKQHPLIFSIFSSEDFGPEESIQPFIYKCEKCKIDGYAKEGRYYCRFCKYNLCEKCEANN